MGSLSGITQATTTNFMTEIQTISTVVVQIFKSPLWRQLRSSTDGREVVALLAEAGG